MNVFGAAVDSFLGALGSSPSPLVGWFLQAFALLQALSPVGWPESYSLYDGATFDFVVVGAGSAGAAVAARLSERPWRVLLLEAGGDPPPTSVLPSTFSFMAHTNYDWDYIGQNDKGIAEAHNDRNFFVTRGKMLGGSSSLNYHIYARGVPEDYDEWARVAPGWDWVSVLPYFKKLENMTDPTVTQGRNAPLHSTTGPVKISRPIPNQFYQQINEILLNSFAEMGIPRVAENNGYETLGVSLPHFTFYNGRRSSTAEAYLRPTKDRHNLYVTKFATVNRVLIDYKNQARGVEVMLRSGRVIKVYANLEVILSAGAINTPKILMLSGIGPKEELNKFGIDVVADLPVGKNLQDHGVVPVVLTGEKGLQTAFQNLLVATELDAYPVPMQSGFFNVNNTPGFTTRPLFQFFNMHVGAAASFFGYIGCKAIANFDDKFCMSIVEANAVRDLEVTALTYLHPLSRGEVTLRSRNPLDDPIITMGTFRDKEDLRVVTAAFKFLLGLSQTTYFKKVHAEVAKLKVSACDGIKWGTDDYWECFVRNTIGTLLHQAGTCPMGVDGVVDERLRVHDVLDLRVVDASVMPTLPSGNTNAPSIMIGEKAADMIKRDHDDLTNNRNMPLSEKDTGRKREESPLNKFPSKTKTTDI